jgi:voltage-gated sodium channel
MTQTSLVPDWRRRLATAVEQPRVQHTIIALILVNAGVLGLETSPAAMARWGAALQTLDQAILAVFVVEIAVRMAAHGLRFFRDPWSVFDFIVVGIALMPAAGPFAVLRALRVLRVLRLITIVPSMRRVVRGLLSAIPGLASVFAIISIIFYVAAVIATKLFGAGFPAWFGTIGLSAYSLFQIMTLESWSMGIVRPVMELFPNAWIFFIVFILVSTFTMLNLFIAVIVNAIQAEHDFELREKGESAATKQEADSAAVRAELRALRAEIQSLRLMLAEYRKR